MKITDNPFKLARIKHNQHGKQSVKDVASRTGITKSLIDDLESSLEKKRGASYLTVKKLAEYYGVSSDYLLGLTPHPTPKAEIRAMCDYTGLSDKAVEVLHYATLPEADGVISDTDDWNKKTVSFINRVLELVRDEVIASNPGAGLNLVYTIFSVMEDYVRSGDVWITDYKTGKKERIVTIDDGFSPFTCSVAELAEGRLMQTICSGLRQMRENYGKQ